MDNLKQRVISGICKRGSNKMNEIYLKIIHPSGGKHPSLSPTLRLIIVLVYTAQAE